MKYNWDICNKTLYYLQGISLLVLSNVISLISSCHSFIYSCVVPQIKKQVMFIVHISIIEYGIYLTYIAAVLVGFFWPGTCVKLLALRLCTWRYWLSLIWGASHQWHYVSLFAVAALHPLLFESHSQHANATLTPVPPPQQCRNSGVFSFASNMPTFFVLKPECTDWLSSTSSRTVAAAYACIPDIRQAPGKSSTMKTHI